MVEKRKIGLTLTLFRRNSTPSFCAMLPQVLHAHKSPLLPNHPIHRRKTSKRMNLGAFTSFISHLLMTSGVHQLKRLPEVCMLCHPFFLNLNSMTASNQLIEAAESWITKLSLKKDSGYPVDSNPNPGSTSPPTSSHKSQTTPIQLWSTTICSWKQQHSEKSLTQKHLRTSLFQIIKQCIRYIQSCGFLVSIDPNLSSVLVFSSRHGEISWILMHPHTQLLQQLVPRGRWLVKYFRLSTTKQNSILVKGDRG